MAGKLLYKNIYYFTYNAKGAENKSLHVYDRKPLVLPIDIRSKAMMACNLHWIPKAFRKQFIDIVLDISKTIGTGSRRKILPKLMYATIKANPKLAKIAMGAIRLYIIPRIQMTKVIPPELWHLVVGNPQFRERKLYRDKGYKRK